MQDLWALVEQYFNTVGTFGPGSPETLKIRNENSHNYEFISLADSLDRIRKNLKSTEDQSLQRKQK